MSLAALTHHGSATGLCSVYLLTWIAACDGLVTSDEHTILHDSALYLVPKRIAAYMLQSSLQNNAVDIKYAIDTLRVLPIDQRSSLLQLAILIGLADKHLVTAENHALRFIADALKLGRAELNRLFLEITGNEIPPISDPSSMQWWRAQEASSKKSNDTSSSAHDKSESRTNQETTSDATKIADLATLGLPATASIASIRAAYRRLAMIHHPDRFHSLGKEAQNTADGVFKSINEAYERLIGNA